MAEHFLPKKPSAIASNPASQQSSFDINKILEASKTQLTSSQQAKSCRIGKCSGARQHKRTKVGVYKQLASFYKDSAQLLFLHAYYTGEAAKLENSEKSLTFAARFFLESARKQHDEEA